MQGPGRGAASHLEARRADEAAAPHEGGPQVCFGISLAESCLLTVMGTPETSNGCFSLIHAEIYLQTRCHMMLIKCVLHTSGTRHLVRLNACSMEAHAALLDALGANPGLRELDLECSALVCAPGAPELAVSLPNLRTLRVS